MSTTQLHGRPPAGRKGLPLLGETMAFAKNPFRFIEERLAAHGSVFRSNVLGRDTVVLAGPEATTQFVDDARIMREGSMPPHVQELFGGKSLPLLDGDVHRARKSLVMQGFTRDALTTYLPLMQSAVEAAFADWAARPEIRWIDELKKLSIEIIGSTVIGLSPGPEMDALRRDYAIVTDGFATLPINLPGTRYNKALKARDRILALLRKKVIERRAAPAKDGLSRMLAARTPLDGAMSDDEAVLELHHAVIAGFIIFGELAAIARQLAAHPDVRQRLADEIRSVAPTGALTVESLMRMPYLGQVMMEVKRLTPIVPAVFGRSRTSFDVGGVTIPAGWMVMWAITPTHTTHGKYTDSARFDPDRFSSERAEEKRHEHAFVPQGAGPVTGHRCPGLDFATYAMELFTIVLLRGYDWVLPPQSFDLDWSKTPPEPKDGLKARVRAV
jgi:cytochrome P450